MSEARFHDCTILLVDDEESNLDLLEGFLRGAGYQELVRTSDSREALPLMERHRPDLVLLDLRMPHQSGFAVLRDIRARTPPDDYLPVLVLTADVAPESRELALASGARDFLTKPLDITEVLLRVHNLLETRILYRRQQEARRAAEAARERDAFLLEAGRVLASSFDYTTTLAQLARLAVPQVADCCLVDLLEDDGSFVLAGVAHVDPAKEARIRDVAPEEGSPDHPLADLFRARRPMLLPEVSDDFVDGVMGTPVLRTLGAQLSPHSAMVVPLRNGDRLIGGLTLLSAESGRNYTPEDLDLAEALGRRAALAVDNARLFHRAQQATAARDHMLAVVAHDLRNPISTVSMAASLVLEMLDSDPARAIERRQLELMHRAAVRMDQMVGDLLDVSRIEGGTLKLERRPERLAVLLEEASSMLQPLAEARSIRLETVHCDGDSLADMDAPRVLQVVSNLVGNALKFTPRGGRITLSCEAREDELRVSVTDTGTGISKEQLPHVFARFWQARAGDRRGIGLGLSIARGIVEGHGGRIWVESEEDAGSTFTFTLPRAAATAPDALGAAARPPTSERPPAPSA